VAGSGFPSRVAPCQRRDQAKRCSDVWATFGPRWPKPSGRFAPRPGVALGRKDCRPFWQLDSLCAAAQLVGHQLVSADVWRPALQESGGRTTTRARDDSDTDLEPRHEDAVSQLPSLSDTGRGRWQRFGLLHATGFDYGEIAERTGVATGEIGAELEALRQELRSLS
jgi:hypothetical protein